MTVGELMSAGAVGLKQDATVAEARRLFATLDLPNVMIKIPATVAGLPAITETIAARLISVATRRRCSPA